MHGAVSCQATAGHHKHTQRQIRNRAMTCTCHYNDNLICTALLSCCVVTNGPISLGTVQYNQLRARVYVHVLTETELIYPVPKGKAYVEIYKLDVSSSRGRGVGE